MVYHDNVENIPTTTDNNNNNNNNDVELSQVNYNNNNNNNNDRFVDEEGEEHSSSSDNININYASGPSPSSLSYSSSSLPRPFVLGSMAIFVVILLMIVVFSNGGNGNGGDSNHMGGGDNGNGDDEQQQQQQQQRIYDIDPNDPCQVFNENGVDVTDDVYNPYLRLVNCTGDRRCSGYTSNYCQHLLCDGSEACYEGKFYNISGNVQCLDIHACHLGEIHAIPYNEENKNDNNNIEPTNIDCLGTGSCDVTIMTNINNVICTGPQSCRKVRVHANSIKCDDGTSAYNACDASATFVFTKCLMCGNNYGCGHAYNQCRYRQITFEQNNIIDVDYFNGNYMGNDQWTKCTPGSIIEGNDGDGDGDGDDGQCLPEWKDIYEEENIEDVGDENGGRR